MAKKQTKKKDKIAELEAKLTKLGDEGIQGEDKVDILNKLARSFFNSEPERGLEYTKLALNLSKKLGYEKGIAQSWLNFGVYHQTTSNFDKALENTQKSLELFEKIGDKDGIGNCYSTLGVVSKNRSELGSALEYHLKALEIREELADKGGLATTYLNIGVVYFVMQDANKALEYFLDSQKIFEEVNDKHNLATSYVNAGCAYETLGKLNKSLACHLKALEISEEIGNKNAAALSYYNTGWIYMEQGALDKAFEYQKKGLELFESIGDKRMVAVCYSGIGRIRMDQKRYDEALEYLQKGVELAKKVGAKDPELPCLQLLAELNEVQEDYEKALATYKEYQGLKETLFSEESTDKINQLKMQFETEKKAKEAEIFRLKNEELETMVAERTAKLEKELADRKRIEEELKDKLTLIEEQRAAILELSTPVIKIWEGVLVIPLIGVLDSKRSLHLTEELLTSITETQSKMTIIDITGVPTVDSAVANHLLKTVESVKLLGTECVITGIRPEVAQTIIHLGIDITQLQTRATLADGLEWAFRRIGV